MLGLKPSITPKAEFSASSQDFTVYDSEAAEPANVAILLHTLKP